MRTTLAITNPSGFPYQWAHIADYAPRDGTTDYARILGNPFTMRAVTGDEIGALLLQCVNNGMRTLGIRYPYDFSDRAAYQRGTAGARAPYGL